MNRGRFCVRELVAGDAKLALEGDEEVSEEGLFLIRIFLAEREVAFVFEAPSGDDGREIII